MKAIISENLKKFRKGLGLTQIELAKKTNISRSSIIKYERGESIPNGSKLNLLAKALDVGIDSILSNNKEIDNFKYRAHEGYASKDNFLAKIREMISSYIRLEDLLAQSAYSPESISSAHLKNNVKLIKETAKQFRNRMGLGDEPIHNLFRETENIGLKVLRKNIPINNFWGLSAYSINHGAFILINSYKTTIERQIFTLAHEIGHLIFHKNEYRKNFKSSTVHKRNDEKIANIFASNLLVPDTSFEKITSSTNDLIKIKSYFRVSYKVILKKYEEFNKINYDDTLDFIKDRYKEINGKPLKDSDEIEPSLTELDIKYETRFRNLTFQALDKNIITESRAAELLGSSISNIIEERSRRREPLVL